MRMATLVFACAGCGFHAAGQDGDAAGHDGVPATDGVPAIDALDAPIDASFDPARDCPAMYGIAIGGSRYRIRGGNSDTYEDHHDACADDTLGLTHLVVISDAGEAAALAGHPAVCASSCDSFWTGLFSPDGVAFQTVTTEPVFAQWDTGQPEDFDEPPVAAIFNPASRSHSDTAVETAPTTIRSLCECDGRAAEDLPWP